MPKQVFLDAPEHSVVVVACGNACRVLCYTPKFADDLPTCSSLEVAPMGYMSTEIFTLWLQHFVKKQASWKCFAHV